jgi:F420H(2)-dependent quinone reductase
MAHEPCRTYASWGHLLSMSLALTRLANPVVRSLLRSRLHRLLSSSVLELSYTGRHSGKRHMLPVMYTTLGNGLIVVAAQPDTKTWWRNFDSEDRQVEIRLRGQEQKARMSRLSAGKSAHSQALAAYRARFPQAPIEPDVPIFTITAQS